MNRQIIHYKLIFTGPENEMEIRYLAMETISYHNYLYFIRKLISVFPILKDLPFSVNWKDNEGDIVKICTDDELTIALDEMKSDPVKKIFIIVKQRGNETILHPNIVCGSCNQHIKGFRYKCLVCADFELCSDCERSQTHSDHPMIRIPKPLSPDTPYGKQFSKDIPKISQHLERLFQPTGDEIIQSSNQKNSTDSKQRFRFCQNDIHNLIANLLVEKLIKHNNETSHTQQKSQPEFDSSQTASSSSTNNFNVLTSGLRSLSIDVNSGCTRREGLTEQEPVHSISEGERQVTSTSTTAANKFPSTTIEAASSSDESNPMNQYVSQIDAAPIPVDPTPALQAQLTPPIRAANSVLAPIPVSNVSTTSSPSNNNLAFTPSVPTAITPVPLPRQVATTSVDNSINTASLCDSNNFPVHLIPPPIEEDGSLDNSWSVVENEQIDTSVTSSDSIASLESLEAIPTATDSSSAQKIEQIDTSVTSSDSIASLESLEAIPTATPAPTDSSSAQKIEQIDTSVTSSDLIASLESLEAIPTAKPAPTDSSSAQKIEQIDTSVTSSKSIASLESLEAIPTAKHAPTDSSSAQKIEQIDTSVTSSKSIASLESLEAIPTAKHAPTDSSSAQKIEQIDTSVTSSKSIASLESLEAIPTAKHAPTDSSSAQKIEQIDTSVTSSKSIASLESLEAIPTAKHAPTDSSSAQKIGPYEESISILHSLGFEKKEWLNIVVESKKGKIREVLKFLLPIKKPSTNLQN